MAALALSALYDKFTWLPWRWEILRNDELSGSGDGRYWSSPVAPPLWTATLEARRLPNTKAEQLLALLRSLNGQQTAFRIASPVFCAPMADPTGVGLSGASLSLSSIAANRLSVTLAGMPAGYKITTGDKLSITYSGGVYFAEARADAVASGGTVTFGVFPSVPLDLVAGVSVDLLRPSCPVILHPEDSSIGSFSGGKTDGIGFRVIQKKGVS